MSPLNAAICITTYLERQKCYGPDKKIQFNKQLFDLKVKGQGPMKVITVCDTALWSCTHIPNKYYLKNNYLTLISKVKVPRRSLWYATHRLMVMHPHTKYHWPISKDKNVMVRTRKYYLKNNYLTLRSRSHEDRYGTRHTALWSCTHIPNIIDLSRKTKNVMAWTRKYYLKNNYLTLRSKVKVPQRSLWYATHRLMVMHPHTKYHWPISKEKNVMTRTRKYYLKNIIWPWGQMSRSHEGHYGMRHTTFWSCTHIPNIIDRYGKTTRGSQEPVIAHLDQSCFQ
jgi:hypothetical protein